MDELNARPKIRLYLDVPLAAGAALEPSAAQAHHLLVVMRQRAGDTVALFNGRDGEWLATVEPMQRRRCRLDVGQQLRPQESEPGPALLFSPLKRIRQELLAEKATELGVTRLEPVLTYRSVVDRVSQQRLQAITIEAAEQSGRLTVPEIALLQPLHDRIADWPSDRRLYLGDTSGDAHPVLEALDEHGPGDFLIGPEGGFDPEELVQLRACEAVIPISLGPRTLRAETAAIAALACWQAELGPLA